MTLFVRHCEGQRPEAISQLRLLRRRNDDLAGTTLIGHPKPFSCSHSEPRSSEESPRLLRKRYYDLAVTKKGAKRRGISESGSTSQQVLFMLETLQHPKRGRAQEVERIRTVV
jgi:hypothetical protein